MRVALVYRNFNLGGSLERDVSFLAQGLSACGVEVHCYSNPATRAVDLSGVTHHDVKPTRPSRGRVGYALECASFAAAATRALRRDRSRYDVIDVTGIAAWEHDIVTVHAVTRGQQSRWVEEAGQDYRAARLRSLLAVVTRPQVGLARAIERRQYRPGRFRRLIAVTEQVKQDLMRFHRVPGALIDVIPPPIALDRFASSNGSGVRASLGLTASDRLLLFVGDDFRRKGLLEAIESLVDLDPDAHLVVVGGGKPKEFMRAAEAVGVLGRVHFVGRTDTPERLYHEADLLLLPTKSEPWGIPLIEAMAAGVPVVTTEIAGAAEFVRKAEAGVILPDSSPTRLRETVRTLLRNPDLRRSMGERGRAAAASFSVEAHVAAVLEAYGRALADRGTGKRAVANTTTANRVRRCKLASAGRASKWNPYSDLLYRNLANHGIEAGEEARLTLRWLFAARRDVLYLHFQWPQGMYNLKRGPALLRGPLSRIKLLAFTARLAVARLLGYRIVWTIHQVYPHETVNPRLDRRGAMVLARHADLLLALDTATADSARAELGPVAGGVHVIPHGSYVGVYPPGRPRSSVRAELEIPDDSFAFLHFGLLRAYKDVDLLLAAFESADIPNGILVIAGFPHDKALSRLLERHAREPRIRLLRGFIPAEQVTELFGACDAAVIPRSDGGTSGSIVLALSMATPVIVADTRTYRDLTDNGEAGWLFRPGDASSLRKALEQAAIDPEEGRRKGAAAGRMAARLDWDSIAARTAALLRGIAP